MLKNIYKKYKYNSKMKGLNKLADRLGCGLDEGIKETVALLQLLGFPTISSCEGHSDHGNPAPWVMFSASGEPKWRYVNQEKVYEIIGKKHNLTVVALKNCDDYEAWKEAEIESAKNPITPEYEVWNLKNVNIGKELQSFVDKFYRQNNRLEQIEDNVLIRVRVEEDYVRLYNGKKYDDILLMHEGKNEWPVQEIPQIEIDLKKCQDEFKIFTEFLRNIYFKTLK